MIITGERFDALWVLEVFNAVVGGISKVLPWFPCFVVVRGSLKGPDPRTRRVGHGDVDISNVKFLAKEANGFME